MKFNHYLQIHSIKKEGRVEMMFEIVTDRLTFWLDRTNEIPEWSSDYIQNNKKEFEKELKQLFENKMTVKYKGNRTIIRLVNKSGKEIRKFTYYQGLWINMFSKKTIKSFEPYF